MPEIIGTSQPDNISGLSEDDLIFGLQENDVLSGNAGNDSIYGGRGNDVLSGNSGSDVLFGDRGADIVTGGDGADVFVLSRNTGADASGTSGGLTLADADNITDFTDNLDVIGLSRGLSFADLNLLEAGNDTFIQDRVTGEFLAALRGIKRSSISEADFSTTISSIQPSPLPGVPTTAYALTAANRIVGFNTFAPGNALSNVSVTGLQAGESLLGIDFRPANG
ncbi:MAG TPA: calcium-binding protein, partial [Kamptonema sp.]|nr:calcium-binding protein [Kamptonema sp.]